MRPLAFLFLFLVLILLNNVNGFSETFTSTNFSAPIPQVLVQLDNVWNCFDTDADGYIYPEETEYNTYNGIYLTSCGDGCEFSCSTNLSTIYTFSENSNVSFYCSDMEDDSDQYYLAFSNEDKSQGLIINLNHNNDVAKPSGFSNLDYISINTASYSFGNDCDGTDLELKIFKYVDINKTYNNITKIWIMDRGQTPSTDGKIDDILIQIDNPVNNSIPTVSLIDEQSVYCFNESDNTYDFYLNIDDSDGDSISYFPFWNDDFQDYTLVDDFSGTDYNLISNGWAMNVTGCNYSTSDGYLKLYPECDNIGLIKWIDDVLLNTSFNLYFDAWVFHNTTADYCVMNGYNERLLCLRMASYYDGVYNDLYTNFSYWNGTDFIDFDSSYYTGIFSVDFDINSTTAGICVSGIDEPVYNDCIMQVTEELHGTTNNVPAKFFISPEYNFGWSDYQTPYIYQDSIKYKTKDTIYWYSYSDGDKITHLFEQQGQEYLNIYVTDTVHTPNYKTYVFPITVNGLCGYDNIYDNTTTTENIQPFLDLYRDYLPSIENGEDIFTDIFFILMFIFFIYLLITLRDLALTCTLVGLVFTIVGWIFSTNPFTYFSSFVLFALGGALIVSRS